MLPTLIIRFYPFPCSLQLWVLHAVQLPGSPRLDNENLGPAVLCLTGRPGVLTMCRGRLHCSPQDMLGSPLNMSTSRVYCHSLSLYKSSLSSLSACHCVSHSPGCPLCPASLAILAGEG